MNINPEITKVIVGCGGSAIHYQVVPEENGLFHYYQCHKIKDESFNDGLKHNSIFVGYDKNNKQLFKIINQPVTIEYKREYAKQSATPDDIPF